MLYRAYVYFTCPETFPPHWGAAVQLGPGTFQDLSRQGGFQDVSLREKTEILLKADGFCSVPPPPNAYTWRTNTYSSLPEGFAPSMFTLASVLHLPSY